MSLLSIIFLTQDEIRDLTDLRFAKAQIRWLSKHSYPFEISAAGKPKVLRSLLFDRLSKVPNTSNSNQPNFDAIRK